MSFIRWSSCALLLGPAASAQDEAAEAPGVEIEISFTGLSRQPRPWYLKPEAPIVQACVCAGSDAIQQRQRFSVQSLTSVVDGQRILTRCVAQRQGKDLISLRIDPGPLSRTQHLKPQANSLVFARVAA